jgi:hypothetical protein
MDESTRKIYQEYVHTPEPCYKVQKSTTDDLSLYTPNLTI